MGKTTQKIMMPMQPGDVKRTWADTSQLEAAIGYKPKTKIEEGVRQFAVWFNAINY